MNKKTMSKAGLAAFLCVVAMVAPAAGQDFSGVPGTVLSYRELSYWTLVSPAPRTFISDPEILVLSNGTYIAAHALAGWDSGSKTSGKTTVFRSTNKGSTWVSLGTFNGMLRASLFEHDGALYLLGSNDDTDNNPLRVMKSTNSGTSWTSAQFDNRNGPATPNNPVVLGDHLWIASGTSNLSAPVVSNLVVEASWKSTGGFPAYKPGWASGGAFIGEGQIVASPELGLFILPKVKDLALTAVSRVNSATQAVTFDPVSNFIDLPGGEKKFGAAYDSVSGKFFVLSNPLLQTAPAYLPSATAADPDMIRNTAAVLTSKDLLNWKVEKIFLYTGHIDRQGFGYFNFDFDGDDLAVAARTAWIIPGQTPPNSGRGGHDSNTLTFHKVSDFRSASPDQYLKISGNQVLRFERTPEAKDDDVPLGPFTLGNTFAGSALASPNGIGKGETGEVYIREGGGRILRFDPLGNFIATTSSPPVSFSAVQIDADQPPAGECAWVKSGSGDWTTPTNWYYWGRPDTAEEVAVFGSAIAAPAAINIPSAAQVWGFNTADDKEGWAVANAADHTVSGGALQGTANTASTSVQISRTDRFFYGSTVPEVHIRMRSDANCDVYFYWGTSQADAFAAARRLTGSYTGNGDVQDVVFTMSGNVNWDGQAITRMRFDPRVHSNGANREFAVDSITVPRESFRIKGLRFRSEIPYSLSGNGKLRIQADGGLGSVQVLQGKHSHQVELILGSDTDMALAGNTALHLTKGIGLGGRTLRVTGTGRLFLQGALRLGGGTLATDGGTPLAFTNNSTGAVLDGTLAFLPEEPFSPSAGETFRLLDNPGILGAKRFAAVSLPSLSAGLQWNTNALYTSGSVSVDAEPRTLTVSTPYGTSVPASGVHICGYGTNLAASVGSPVPNGAATQYVCIGWSGTGSAPASGSAAETGTFALTEDSSLTWLWSTNYWLEIMAGTGGGTDIQSGWQAAGGSSVVTAVPGAGWLFSGWSGNTNGCTINGNIITAPMTAARTITANFEIDPLSLPNTWQVNASGTWTNGANWTDGIIPGISGGSNSTDIVIFSVALTTNRVVTVDANRNISGIIFANPANLSGVNPATTVGYTLSGGSLKLSNGGVIQANDLSGTNTSTVVSPVSIQGNGGSATFRNDAAGNKAGLTVAGAVYGNSTAGNTTTLYLDGVSTSTGIGGNSRNNIIGVVSNGPAGGNVKLVKNGTGLWTVGLTSPFTGGFEVNAGTVRYFSNGNRGFGNGTVTIANGITFSKANATDMTLTNRLVVNGNFTSGGNINMTWGGAMDFMGGVRTLTFTANQNISGVISNGGLIKAGASVLILSNANTYALGTTVSAGTLVGAANGAFGTGHVTVAGGATLTLGATNGINNAATLTLATNAALDLNFSGADTVGGLSLDDGATWLPYGSYTAAQLDTLGGGTYTGSGSLTVEGFADDPANTPHSWLAQHGLTNFTADAMADADGDGLLTWQEYVAGTNPTNPASVFEITGSSVNAQGAVIRWASVSNKLYSLSRTTHLLQSFAAVAGATNLPATPPENVYTNPAGHADASFYRVDVYK